MGKDILKEIVEKRKADIERLGLDFGCGVPVTRTRNVHPFIEKKGAILEIKRASPSKGDIAPDLDAAKTACQYAKAGASAISCLTEMNYFKGSLCDFMKTAAALDQLEAEGHEVPALLRKDFLLSADEVEVSYRAGADAVLLIARILTAQTMFEMAKKAEELGIKLGDFMMPIRMAVTGSRVSPPLIGSILVLGKERALARLERTLATL